MGFDYDSDTPSPQDDVVISKLVPMDWDWNQAGSLIHPFAGREPSFRNTPMLGWGSLFEDNPTWEVLNIGEPKMGCFRSLLKPPRKGCVLHFEEFAHVSFGGSKLFKSVACLVRGGQFTGFPIFRDLVGGNRISLYPEYNELIHDEGSLLRDSRCSFGELEFVVFFRRRIFLVALNLTLWASSK